jgi:anti-sigma-K factor RskA
MLSDEARLDAPAPDGHTYEAWVIVEGKVQPAGLFQSGSTRTVAPLSVPVPDGALVGVTVEPAGGSTTPSGEMVVTSRAV